MKQRDLVRRFLIYGLYILLAFLLQSIWPDSLSFRGQKPNLLLLLPLLAGSLVGPADACVLAFIAGFLLDFAAGRHMGLGMLIFLACVLVTAKLFRPGGSHPFLTALEAVAAGTVMFQAASAILLWLELLFLAGGTGHASLIRLLLTGLWPAVAVNAAASAGLWLLLSGLGPYRKPEPSGLGKRGYIRYEG